MASSDFFKYIVNGAKSLYSKSVLSGLGLEFNITIRDSNTGSSVLKKEIARVFQQANRRIQNVEKSGVFSTALQGLYEQGYNRDKYTKFSVSGYNVNDPRQWARLKSEYGKALSFLNSPTSSARGAKQYGEFVARKNNVDFETAQRLLRNASENAKYLSNKEKYAQFSPDNFSVQGAYKTENELANDRENEMQSEINRMADEILEQAKDIEESFRNDNGFDIGSSDYDIY